MSEAEFEQIEQMYVQEVEELKAELGEKNRDLQKLAKAADSMMQLVNENNRLKDMLKYFEVNYRNQFLSNQNTIEDLKLENLNLKNKLGRARPNGRRAQAREGLQGPHHQGPGGGPRAPAREPARGGQAAVRPGKGGREAAVREEEARGHEQGAAQGTRAEPR